MSLNNGCCNSLRPMYKFTVLMLGDVTLHWQYYIACYIASVLFSKQQCVMYLL